MVERVSALEGALRPRRLGLEEEATPRLVLSERRIASLWQIGAWPGRLAEVGAAAAAAAGAEAAPGPGGAVEGSAGTLLRLEALKWQLVSEARVAQPDIGPEDGTVLDLSHARAAIRIAGPARGELLARLVPLDLRAERFGPGQAAASGAHGIGVTLIGRQEAVDILVLRSFALALWERILESAPQFGAEIV